MRRQLWRGFVLVSFCPSSPPLSCRVNRAPVAGSLQNTTTAEQVRRQAYDNAVPGSRVPWWPRRHETRGFESGRLFLPAQAPIKVIAQTSISERLDDEPPRRRRKRARGIARSRNGNIVVCIGHESSCPRFRKTYGRRTISLARAQARTKPRLSLLLRA